MTRPHGPIGARSGGGGATWTRLLYKNIASDVSAGSRSIVDGAALDFGDSWTQHNKNTGGALVSASVVAGSGYEPIPSTVATSMSFAAASGNSAVYCRKLLTDFHADLVSDRVPFRFAVVLGGLPAIANNEVAIGFTNDNLMTGGILGTTIRRVVATNRLEGWSATIGRGTILSTAVGDSLLLEWHQQRCRVYWGASVGGMPPAILSRNPTTDGWITTSLNALVGYADLGDPTANPLWGPTKTLKSVFWGFSTGEVSGLYRPIWKAYDSAYLPNFAT